MWSTTGALFVFTGLVVWLLEHKFNDTFRGKPKEQVTTFLWYSFSTLFFSQREKVVSSLARGVIIIWLFVVLILQSSYTANLTAILTLKQLQPTIQDVESLKSSGAFVGYQDGSFVDDYLVDQLGMDRTKLKSYSSSQEYADALSNKSVAAIFDELPYICVFLSEKNGFTIVGPTYRTGGLGFAFPKRSPFVSDISLSVLEISEGSAGSESQNIRKKYFNNTDCSNAGPPETSNRLNMESFWGLFLITGTASATGLLIYLGRLVYKYVRHRLPHEQQQFPSTKHLISSRLKSFANYMDEKKLSVKSKEISQESDQNLPETPDLGTSISTPPPAECPCPVNVTTGTADEDEGGSGNEGIISSASSSRSSSFSLPIRRSRIHSPS
jgi:ionotropic glutamate receptor